MGEEATRLTGYPAISIFHDFKYHPKMVISGGDVDWVYDFLGVYAWVTEFWSPQRAAGISDYHFIDWIREHPPEDDVALLKLADEVGEGYVDWYPFEHPQLGPVELGGWDLVRFWFNPPLSQARGRGDAARRLRALPRARLAEARDAVVRVRACRRGRLPPPPRPRERRLASDEGHRRRRSTGRPCARSRSSSSSPRARASRRGKPREEAGQLEGRVERRAVHVVGRRPLDERPHEARVGHRGARGRRRSASSPGTSARAPPAPSSCSEASLAMVLS